MSFPVYVSLIASGTSQKAIANLSTSALGYGSWGLKVHSISIEDIESIAGKSDVTYALFCNFIQSVETKSAPDKWAAEETPLLLTRIKNKITYFHDNSTPFVINHNNNLIKFHLAGVDNKDISHPTCAIKIHFSISRLR